MIFYLILIVHLLVCLAVLFGIAFDWLHVHNYMFFVVAFLPFWGLILVLAVHVQTVSHAEGIKTIGVEKLKLDSAVYRSLTVDDKKNADMTIPMEEALLINSSSQRRALILDILNDNPKEYIEFLQKAGDNDDTEVVHYAVTAMVEISKENDEILHRLEQCYNDNPDQESVLEEYTEFLWHCLDQGMMQGQVEVMNRELFSTLMHKKLEQNGNSRDFERLIQNELKRKNYTEAAIILEQMKRRYPEEEMSYLLQIRYLASIGRGEEIKSVLAEIQNKHIFLSAEGRETIAFWEE